MSAGRYDALIARLDDCGSAVKIAVECRAAIIALLAEAGTPHRDPDDDRCGDGPGKIDA